MQYYNVFYTHPGHTRIPTQGHRKHIVCLGAVGTGFKEMDDVRYGRVQLHISSSKSDRMIESEQLYMFC
jgi:hypothetical protein